VGVFESMELKLGLEQSFLFFGFDFSEIAKWTCSQRPATAALEEK
jgi:hypothetical protein